MKSLAFLIGRRFMWELNTLPQEEDPNKIQDKRLARLELRVINSKLIDISLGDTEHVNQPSINLMKNRHQRKLDNTWYYRREIEYFLKHHVLKDHEKIADNDLALHNLILVIEHMLKNWEKHMGVIKTIQIGVEIDRD